MAHISFRSGSAPLTSRPPISLNTMSAAAAADHFITRSRIVSYAGGSCIIVPVVHGIEESYLKHSIVVFLFRNSNM